jgi:Ca2+-binding EF-hand superfamily protein
MAFHTMKFGETCDRHPPMAYRGVDKKREVTLDARVPSAGSLKAGKTSDWADWGDRPAPPTPASTAPRTGDRLFGDGPGAKPSQRGHAAGPGASSLGAATPPLRPSSAAKPSSFPAPLVPAPTLSMGSPARSDQRPATATAHLRPDQMPPSAAPHLRRHAPEAPPAGKKNVVDSPHSQDPPQRPAPAEPMQPTMLLCDTDDFAQRMAEADQEARLDALCRTMCAYVAAKLNYTTDVQALARGMQALLRKFCGAPAITRADLPAALSSMNLQMSAADGDALFHRFNVSGGDAPLEYKAVARCIVGLAPIPRANPVLRLTIADVRKTLSKRYGTNAVAAMRSAFAVADSNKGGDLSQDELFNYLQKLGVRLSYPETCAVFKCFDLDRSGGVSMGEFMSVVRGPMNRAREALVKRVFGMLDTNGDGRLLPAELKHRYDASRHPEVMSGTMTEEDAVGHMMAVWEKGGGPADGIVTWAEFVRYYNDISSTIQSDEYFELMMRNCWHLSGGEGAAANTTCRRVLATFDDGAQRVVEIHDDLGIGPKDLDKMKAALERQGETGVVKVEVA